MHRAARRTGISRHGRAHLLRAVLEGVALSLADCAQAARAAALAVHELRIIGGGARSRLWSQIVADALGRPLLVPALSDASSGAALLELYRDARESLGPLTRRLTQLTTTAEPDAAKDW